MRLSGQPEAVCGNDCGFIWHKDIPPQGVPALDMFGAPNLSNGPGEASLSCLCSAHCCIISVWSKEFSPQPDPAPGSQFSLLLRLIIPCPSFIASPLMVGSGSSLPGLHILQIFAAGLFCPESVLG